MSENHGLDYGMPERERPVTLKKRPRYRMGKIKVDTEVKDEAKRMQQTSIPDYRYNPLQRGSDKLSNYRTVPKPARERCLKKDPLRPAVSFIPRATILEDQPALMNPANPEYYVLRADPMTEIPDQTVCNNIYYERSLKKSNKQLNDMLTTRGSWMNTERLAMRRLDPNAPELVEVRQHRNTLADQGLMHRGLKKKSRSRPLDRMMKDDMVHDVDKHRRDRELEARMGVINQNPDTLLSKISFTGSL